jgi:hypothetical protein
MLLKVLSENKPSSAKEIVKASGINEKNVWDGLYYWWKKGLLLRAEKPTFENQENFKGRRGLTRNTRFYYLYMLKPKGEDSVFILGQRFVAFKKKYLDLRGSRNASKARSVFEYLRDSSDKAFFSTDIAKNLEKKGVLVRDVMGTVRRYESSIYVRGYRTDQRQTPFKEGFLLTWIDQNKPREQAIEEAIQRTDKVLAGRNSTNPLIERVHSIRDMIIESTKLKDLISFQYMKSQLGCTENEIEKAADRALQLYPDLREVKLFNVYRYYHHASMGSEDLKAAIEMKENYLRIVKGRDNRVGHNWEAVPEWFIDKFTTGARFWIQKHRTDNMDDRRITIHLIKPVGGRRNNAEVDRVWEVSPGVFATPITYVLECKWGLIEKKYIDDFFEVLRWSKEFGVDGSEGRQIRQGVIGVFAGSAFDPKENVKLKDESTISLASHAARINVQLLKAADFNEKMRERGFGKEITAQRICRIAKDEREVRDLLNATWEAPEKSDEILSKSIERNKDVYDFEKVLEKAES